MAKEVKIKIGGDKTGAENTIADLKRSIKSDFEEMSKKAETESQQISKAFKAMGIRTEKSIRQSSKKAKEDFEKIKKSGTASASDIRRAHDKMTEKIKRNNAEISKGSVNVGKNLLKLKTPLAAVGKAAGVLAVAGAAVGTALGVKAFAESVKFESAVLDLQKVLGDTEGKASDFTAQATEMSERYGIAAADVLAGATEFKQAGFTIKEAFDLQDIAIQQSIAGGISIEESSERIKNALKGFEIGADQALRLTDVLNEVSNNFGTNTAELATAVADFSPIAKLVGLSIEETAGFLTPVIEVFGSGSEAARAFKTAMLRLADPTAKMDVILEDLGVTTRDQNGEMRELKGVALDIGEAFKSMTKEQAANAAAILFGKDQAGKMSTAFTKMGVVMDVTKTAMGAAGSTAKEVGVRLGSAAVQAEVAKTQFDNMTRAIGDEFKDALVDIIGDLGDLATEFRKVVEDGGLDPLIEQLKPAMIFIKESVASLASDIPGFLNNLSKGLEGVLNTANVIIRVAQEIKGAFAAALEPFLLIGQGIGFLTDKLGITDSASQVLKFTRQNVAEQGRQKFRVGGEVQSEGHIPGYGGGDRVKILAEAGEFVVRKETVKALGANTLAAINRMDMGAISRAIGSDKVQKFQEGGLVQDPGGQSVNVNLQLNGNSHSFKTDSNTKDNFLNDIKTINIIHGRARRPY